MDIIQLVSVVTWGVSNICLCSRTVLLDRDNKDKKKASLPKSQIVRKPHSSSLPSLSGGSSGRDRTLNSAIPGPSQSSYSGLGPGRGASSARPHSPGQRAVPRPLPTNHSPSQYQTSRPASQPSQTTDHQHRSQAKYPSALKSNSSKPMNTEIMKKTLRSANATGNLKRGQFLSPSSALCRVPIHWHKQIPWKFRFCFLGFSWVLFLRTRNITYQSNRKVLILCFQDDRIVQQVYTIQTCITIRLC